MDGIVFVVDDDCMICIVLIQVLICVGCKVYVISLLIMLMCWVGEGKGDVVIIDVMMFDGNGLEMLFKIFEDCL